MNLQNEPEINLFNLDCMEGMKNTPDKFYDLAIVDPPYGIGLSNASQIGYNGFNVFVPKDWDNHKPDKQYFSELFRVSKNQIIWGGNYFISNLYDTRCFIIWDKGEGFENRTYAECELAWTSFDANTFKIKRDPLAKGDYKNKINPAQKPVYLYEKCLGKCAKEGDKILDTHLGSGSIAIACYDLGFDLTGYEIDKDYFEAMTKRFERHKQQLKLQL